MLVGSFLVLYHTMIWGILVSSLTGLVSFIRFMINIHILGYEKPANYNINIVPICILVNILARVFANTLDCFNDISQANGREESATK